MKLGIGIDTGGTYTDAVIYDFETKRILGRPYEEMARPVQLWHIAFLLGFL